MSREWDANSYHRLSDQQFGWGKKVMARVRVRGDETVLDAGCGTGRVTAELLERLPRGHVVALDLSEKMVRSARCELLPRFDGRVSFVVADVQELPFRECFDGVFSTATFHWAKDHPRLFRSLYTALNPGGWLVAQCGGGPNLVRLRQRAWELLKSPQYARFFEDWSDPWEFASPEVTADRLRQAGFVEIETWTEPAGFVLPDAETFKQYLATVTLHRHIERIPQPRLRQEFLDDMARQASQDPEFTMDYWRLNINAKRP
ncbi:MAG: methyltransferase domain-containing protein [Terriglobales bacterium]